MQGGIAMPWKESCVMDERVKFISKHMRREASISALCREFNISRKTGYTLIHRYELEGPYGLFDRSRAPHHHPHAVEEDLVKDILKLREEHPSWGPRKLLTWLNSHRPRTKWPCASTIGRILARNGMVAARPRARRTPPYSQPFKSCDKPNDIWCADFKGWFRTADGKRCEPLTVTDSYSRYVLACQALPTPTYAQVLRIFENLFRKYGLPRAIRTDNGTPFASGALGGLSRLSVWWIKLGIFPERIEPGHPEQNGRHERFHRTLKSETISPPEFSLQHQQVAFQRFCKEFNYERPHEALDYQTPAARYHPSGRPLPTRPLEIAYPDHMIVRKVRASGQIWWKGKELFISETLAGEPIALEQLDDSTYKIHYGPIELALFDDKNRKIIKPKINWKKRR
jgi:transposase InsO family protein